MLVPGQNINIFDNNKAKDGNWFTGHMNTQALDFDPLVTGYAFFVWTKLPAWVTEAYPGFAAMTQKNFKRFEGLSDMELQTAQYTHTFNNNAYEYATSISKGNTQFTIAHQEFSGNPIKNMYSFWVTGIRDPETDIAVYPRAYGCEYGAKNHTGELIYIVTRPDANNYEKHNIEFAAYYTAVMPLKVPIQHFSYSMGDHNSPEIDITLVGDLHIGPEVDDFAVSVLSDSTNSSDSGINVSVNPYGFVTSALFNPSDSNVLSSDGASLASPGFDESDYVGSDYKSLTTTDGTFGAPPTQYTTDGT